MHGKHAAQLWSAPVHRERPDARSPYLPYTPYPNPDPTPTAPAQGLANADHTTLLLNCYTKLKDVAKLDAFLRGAGAADGRGALPFDVETAVKARRAGALLAVLRLHLSAAPLPNQPCKHACLPFACRESCERARPGGVGAAAHLCALLHAQDCRRPVHRLRQLTGVM
jgi:hypothetical protein